MMAKKTPKTGENGTGYVPGPAMIPYPMDALGLKCPGVFRTY